MIEPGIVAVQQKLAETSTAPPRSAALSASGGGVQAHDWQIHHIDFGCLQPESFHLREEDNLDGDGYLVRFNYADRDSQVQVAVLHEDLHHRFGPTQQRRRGDGNQVKSECRRLPANGSALRRRGQSGQHVRCAEPSGAETTSYPDFVAEPVHSRSGGDFHGKDFVAHSDPDGTGYLHVREDCARDSAT